MIMHIQAERRAFDKWLRTGRQSPTHPIEVKFNPYHDPKNGQFTFAPSGLRSLENVIVSQRTSVARQTPVRPTPGGGIGGNRGPSLYDPMTLKQVFPGLAMSPAGSILAPVDSFLGITGPADALLQQLTRGSTRQLIDQIKAIDPNYRFQSLGEPTTLEGQANQLRGLRLDRAEAYYRVKGELRPLQVEAFKYLQGRVDIAYAQGIRLFEAGKLTPRLSRNEAIGNYVDGLVRNELREFYRSNGISVERGQQVQVNRRAYNVSEGSYTVPDSRVGQVAFDVSLTAKTLSTAQVRGFFRSDFAPTSVIIVRPSQLARANQPSSYIITRPSER
jgi:hypothetical protein